jgi:hypothetical protein
MTVHRLKVWPEYFDDLSKAKPFEIRRDDREPRFDVGDLVCLEEFNENVVGGYTGRWKPARIVKVWRGGAMPDGYCAFTFEWGGGDVSAICGAARADITVSR